MMTLLTGNGRVLLALNADGAWHSLFYPYAGQFQHLREMRMGVFDVEASKFWWLGHEAGFEVKQDYPEHGSVPRTTWKGHGLSLEARDHLHPNHDLIVRVVKLRSDPPRELRLFLYNSLTIAESMYQDTAYADLEQRTLMHYKRGYYFEFFGQPAFDAVVCGEHTLKGLQGTYVDAEDGVISGGVVSHGAADSVLQWDLQAAQDKDTVVRIFLAAGRSREETERLLGYVRKGDSTRFEREAHAFWLNWVRRHPPALPQDMSETAKQLYVRSMLMMHSAASTNGSIIASPDTRSLRSGGDSYNYCWWRDGAYIAKAMDEAGSYEAAGRFLHFAAKCQSPDGSFLHRHFADGAIGSTWHPPPFLQVDQTASVIGAAWHHFKARGDLEGLLDLWPMVKNAANFLVEFRDPQTGLPAASFDLWEERKAIHCYSTAAVVHALERAARIAQELGKDPKKWRDASKAMHTAAAEQFWDAKQHRLVRSLQPRDEKVDASLLLALKLGLFDWKDPRARQVVDAVEGRLWVKGTGGLARYEGDQYWGPENAWVICTLWLAEARLNLGDPARCRELLEWVAERASPTLMLPEQFDSRTGEATSVTPLTWSHSTFVDVGNKYARAVQGREAGEP